MKRPVGMWPAVLGLAMLLGSSLTAAEGPPRAEDLYRKEIEAVQQIAASGKDANTAEKEILRYARRKLLGRWMAPWVYDAVTRIRPEGDHLRLLKQILDSTDYFEGGAFEPNRVFEKEGNFYEVPDLGPDFAAQTTKVWGAYFSAIRRYFELEGHDGRLGQLAVTLSACCAPRILLPVVRGWYDDPRSSPQVREVAALVLGSCGHESPDTTKALIQGLSSPDACVRAACAEGLGRQTDPYHPAGDGRLGPTHPLPKEATLALVPVLKDPEAEVRMQALLALRRISWQATDATPALLELISKGSPKDSQQAAETLAYIGAPELVGPMLAHLKPESSAKERAGAISALEDLGFILHSKGDKSYGEIAKQLAPSLLYWCERESTNFSLPRCISARPCPKPAIREAMMRMNLRFIEHCRRGGLFPLTVSPFAVAEGRAGKLCRLDTTTIRKLLKDGQIPLLHGDIILDSRQGFGIASTEELLAQLAEEIRFDRIVMLTDVDGVHDGDGVTIPLITPRNVRRHLGSLSGSRGPDVTGGMADKVKNLLRLVESGRVREARIMASTPRSRNLFDAILGTGSAGTLIRRH